jgi:D-serine dehydratase
MSVLREIRRSSERQELSCHLHGVIVCAGVSGNAGIVSSVPDGHVIRLVIVSQATAVDRVAVGRPAQFIGLLGRQLISVGLYTIHIDLCSGLLSEFA